MSVLSLVLLSLAKVTTAIALRSRDNDLLAKRSASLQLEANKLGAVPYDSLRIWSTTDTTIVRGNFQYRRHLVIRKSATFINRYSVKIVLTPALDSTKKDSVMLDRSQPPSTTPLCRFGC